MTKLRTLLRWRGTPILGIIMVCVLLFGVSYTAASHLADTVQITVQTHTTGGQASIPTTIFDKTINNVIAVQRVQRSLNAVRSIIRYPVTVSCTLAPKVVYDYHLHFTWHGVHTQDVVASANGCYQMQITTLGIPSIWPRDPMPAKTWHDIAALTGMPLQQGV